MNLQELCQAVKNQEINYEMYDSALQALSNPKAEEEQYTLEEYTTLLYVLGAYKEVKGQSVYCGLRIDEVCKKNLYRISKENSQLSEKAEAFRSETMRRVDKTLKLIDRRFININLIMTFILYLILMFFLRMNIIVTSVVAIGSFILNYAMVLPKTKKKYVASQMDMMREDLFDEFRTFESNIY